jgi:DNA-binding transcriptional LysR family regulator
MLSPVYHTFLAVARTGSFAKAAKQLFISSVAVMKQMNGLEAEIGAVLFVRTNHGVSLTHAGRILLEQIARIQKDAEKALAAVRNAAQKDKIPIRVGASMMRPATLLMNICQNSDDIRRKFTLQIIPFSDNQFSEKWLKSTVGEVFDCVTSPYDVESWYEIFGILKLGEEKFKLAVPFSHPLSQYSLIQLSDLAGCTLLTPPRKAPMVDRVCRTIETGSYDIRIAPLPEFYTANTFFEHANELLLTRDSFNIISFGFKTIDVAWDFSSPTGIIYSSYPSPQVAEFISLLKQAIK